MEVAAVEYRNIDQDINLYHGAKRYWNNDDQISKVQLYWTLGDKGYSETEIDNAITDYYYVYIWPNILINRLTWITLAVILSLAALLNFL
jgi:hypothetical protein